MLGWLTQFDADRGYSPRQVEFLGFVTCGSRNDYVWGRLEPPLEPGEAANRQRLDVVLLAPRFEGARLVTPLAVPVHVYVCTVRTNEGELPAVIRVEDVIIRHWGIVYPRLEEAVAGTNM